MAINVDVTNNRKSLVNYFITFYCLAAVMTGGEHLVLNE